MPIGVKVCGLNSREAVAAAIAGGACFLGFVFFARSPRYVRPVDVPDLVPACPEEVRRVGLFVDAGDEEIAAAVAASGIDTLQLHGHEPPDRVAELKRRLGLPVIKALPIAAASDFETAEPYAHVADWLLFDAPPPAGATRPGGNARPIDWSLLRHHRGDRPWILAGGLTAANLKDAVRASHARLVDVSSGVEDRPGVKNTAKIEAFLDRARRLEVG